MEPFRAGAGLLLEAAPFVAQTMRAEARARAPPRGVLQSHCARMAPRAILDNSRSPPRHALVARGRRRGCAARETEETQSCGHAGGAHTTALPDRTVF